MNAAVINEVMAAISAAGRVSVLDASGLAAAQIRLSDAARALADEQANEQRFRTGLLHAFGMMPAFAPSDDTIVELVERVSRACRAGHIADHVAVADDFYDRGDVTGSDAVLALGFNIRSPETGTTAAEEFRAMVERVELAS